MISCVYSIHIYSQLHKSASKALRTWTGREPGFIQWAHLNRHITYIEIYRHIDIYVSENMVPYSHLQTSEVKLSMLFNTHTHTYAHLYLCITHTVYWKYLEITAAHGRNVQKLEPWKSRQRHPKSDAQLLQQPLPCNDRRNGGVLGRSVHLIAW